MATEGNAQEALAALRMSDLVSPYEALELPERALMWLHFRATETPDEQEYQTVLWQRAFNVCSSETWRSRIPTGCSMMSVRRWKKSSDLFDWLQDLEEGQQGNAP